MLVAGLAGGFLAGLLGIGGGIIYVFVLSFVIQPITNDSHEMVRFIIANSAFAIFFASLSGSIRQIRIRNFYFKKVWQLASGAIVSSVLITFLIRNHDWYNKHIFALILMTVLFLLVLYQMFIAPGGKGISIKEISYYRLFSTGFLTGLFAAVTGLGGGIITVPLLTIWNRVDFKQAASVSLGVMPLFTLATSFVYMIPEKNFIPPSGIFSLGYIVPQYVLPLVLGVVIMTPIGVQTASKWSNKTLKAIFIFVMIIVILRMINLVLS